MTDIRCDKCGKEFKSEHGLLTHIGIAHRMRERLEKERLRTCYLKLKRMMDMKIFNLAEMDYILKELKRASET